MKIKKIYTAFQIPVTVRRWIERNAKKRGQTMTTFILSILFREMESENAKSN